MDKKNKTIASGKTIDKPDEDKTFMELFKKWMLETYMQSLSERPNLFLRLVWLVCLLGSVGICAFLITRLFLQYFQYGVTTTIRDIYVDNMSFPMVTVCNVNPMVTPAAEAYIREYILNQTGSDNVTSIYDLNNIKGGIDVDLQFMHYLTYASTFDPNVKLSFGYGVNGIIPNSYAVGCLFGLSMCYGGPEPIK